VAQGKLTISVVTPSFNQARYLGHSITSVRDQTLKPIEHFVFDPGSTDESRAIAASFPHVTLVNEPDDGQTDAVNKGFQRVRGDIVAWLNSDDIYAHSHVLEHVEARFGGPDAPDIVYGRGIYVGEDGQKLRDVYVNKSPESLPQRLQHEVGILQPALFIRRSVLERVGLLRKELHFAMDYDYWIRCMKAGLRFAFLDEDLVRATYHVSNKTYGLRGKSYAEVCLIVKEHFGYVHYAWLKRYAEFLAEGHDGILYHSANAGVSDAEKLAAVYRDLLLACNGDYDTCDFIDKSAASENGCADTKREMQKAGVWRHVPCKPIPVGQAQEPGSVCYTVGARRWAFDAAWKQREIEKSHAFLRKQIENRKSDTCVIVGNGPSLKATDLTLLDGCDTIISNNAFLSRQLLKNATYFTVVNYLVAEQSSQQINTLRGIHKVLPYWTAYCLTPGPDTYFVDSVGQAAFSKDMFKNMSWRHTVTFFNLHLAYGLGYRKIVMIGFDHSYKQAPGVVESAVIQSNEDDVNHFDAAYFKGKKWQAADVDNMEAMYRLAKDAFEEDGRTIINATVGGKLELFERLPLAQALK
jgi:glycosyltransferase involved in cell wall biosynthesis